MRRHLRRYASLAYLNVSEALLRAVGRRPPYGILKVDLEGELDEDPVSARLLGWSQARHGDYLGVLAVLRWARNDPQVRGVFVRCNELRVGWAKVQELQRSLSALRAAGKTVWISLVHAGIREYALACAAQRVILTPTGTLDVTGLSTEVTFIAGALQKLGIEAQLVQMGKYKSAAETFVRSEMSPAHREMIESLIDDLYGQVVDGIAAGRGLATTTVRELIDRGPFVAREAQAAGLVDALQYEDQAEEQLRERCVGARTIEMADYASRRGRWVRRAALRQARATIGILHLNGTIKMGESVPGPAPANATGAASAARDLRELREADDVGAVVLRISSPGGSGLASDLIWHEVERTRRQKPVVISFGDVAASGGYYVGVAGHPVIAEAGTITGSIGVLAGKAVLRGLYAHLGVTKEVVTRGRHAGLYSDYLPLGEEEQQHLRSEAESFYAVFVDKVASGRQLSHEAVDAVAQGRVWTGRQALSHGLVDRLGGLDVAVEVAKSLIGLPPEALAAMERYPKPRRLWKLSLNLKPPHSRLSASVPWLRFLTGERLWAILPFDFRFF